MHVDLNADLGEGAADDAELLTLVTSANIACGGHAGDARLMQATVRAALARGVAIGAHPSYVDREHFGRRELQLDPDDVRADVVTEVFVRLFEQGLIYRGKRLVNWDPVLGTGSQFTSRLPR